MTGLEGTWSSGSGAVSTGSVSVERVFRFLMDGWMDCIFQVLWDEKREVVRWEEWMDDLFFLFFLFHSWVFFFIVLCKSIFVEVGLEAYASRSMSPSQMEGSSDREGSFPHLRLFRSK